MLTENNSRLDATGAPGRSFRTSSTRHKPAGRLPRVVSRSSIVHRSSFFMAYFLPNQRPMAAAQSSDNSPLTGSASRADTTSMPGSTIRSVAPAPRLPSRNLRRAGSPSELVAITSISRETAPVRIARRTYSTMGNSRGSLGG